MRLTRRTNIPYDAVWGTSRAYVQVNVALYSRTGNRSELVHMFSYSPDEITDPFEALEQAIPKGSLDEVMDWLRNDGARPLGFERVPATSPPALVVDKEG